MSKFGASGLPWYHLHLNCPLALTSSRSTMFCDSSGSVRDQRALGIFSPCDGDLSILYCSEPNLQPRLSGLNGPYTGAKLNIQIILVEFGALCQSLLHSFLLGSADFSLVPPHLQRGTISRSTTASVRTLNPLGSDLQQEKQ